MHEAPLIMTLRRATDNENDFYLHRGTLKMTESIPVVLCQLRHLRSDVLDDPSLSIQKKELSSHASWRM
eukprot:scaffold116568_cov17-Prasinocladus_malaysianus.AAC.1